VSVSRRPTGRETGRPSLGVLALLLLVLAAGGAAAAPPALLVEPRFDLDATGARAPFPSNHLTVADPAQRTGLRVALPRPPCAAQPSGCDDVLVLDELDGFDLDPRLSLPFTGPIDPATVTVRSVFLVRLAPGPPEAIGLDRLVYDPDAHTLYGRPESLLEPETRYGLVVTRELRDGQGRPVRRAGGLARFLGQRGGPAEVRAYRDALGRLLATLGRRGLKPEEVVAASVFTTGSVSTFLEQAREGLDRRPPEPATMTAVEGGGRAWFPRAATSGLVLRPQVRSDVTAVDAFPDQSLPLAALPPEVGGLGVGWFRSPWYLTPGRRLADHATGRPLAEPGLMMPIAFVVLTPAGPPPPGGWPVAVMGHGYAGEMFSSALLIAGTLARHGLATVAITVVGHGGGPEGRLLVHRAGERPLEIRVPGRGLDLDGDGAIGRTEGFGILPSSRTALIGTRDALRQQVVDLMALLRALRGGLDVDGDGTPDTRGDRFVYVGQSLGGIYGTLLLAVDPLVQAGVLNVPGGPIAEVARQSPFFRPLLQDALGIRRPSLLNGGEEFREDAPLRGETRLHGVGPGALAIQDFLARAEWAQRRADPVAYARHLRAAPLPGLARKRVLVQLAWGDRIVPNPTTAALVRAGQLEDATVLLRYDRVVDQVPRRLTEPHGFLLRVEAPGVAGALARAAQEQVARFLTGEGGAVWNPDDATPSPAGQPVFEVPAQRLPDRPNFLATD
jgi:dienelactone hydrolase